jgi:hypothetical protein
LKRIKKSCENTDVDEDGRHLEIGRWSDRLPEDLHAGKLRDKNAKYQYSTLLLGGWHSEAEAQKDLIVYQK